MNWTAKARSAAAPAATRTKPGPEGSAAASSPNNRNARVSNGMKEFLWLISDIERGRVLDLGAVSQATLNFFIERGYRISTEDLLRAWKEFLTTEEEQLRQAAVGNAGGGERVSQAMLAEKFLETALQYPEGSYHGVLAWDLFDYLDDELLPRVMQRIYKILSPGGAVLALFHSRAPERFHRYRIVDNQTLEAIPAPTLAVHTRVFQNRQVLDIFVEFRSSKTFVGRDQLREGLFLK
jgi:SAM-dependent methyltransferase